MKKLEKTLTPEENKIIELKYQSSQIGQMDALKLDAAAKILLLRIQVITGWAIPEGELKKILIDEFKKKLTESFSNVNMDEMLHAFRNNTSVKDWGKNMNLALIDEVMQPYLIQRFELSVIEERMKAIPLPPPAEDNDPFTDHEQVDTALRLFKLLKTYRCITQKVAAILYRQKKIEKPNEEDTAQILKQATHDYHEELRVDRNLSYGDKEKEIRKIMNQILCAKYFNSLNEGSY